MTRTKPAILRCQEPKEARLLEGETEFYREAETEGHRERHVWALPIVRVGAIETPLWQYPRL